MISWTLPSLNQIYQFLNNVAPETRNYFAYSFNNVRALLDRVVNLGYLPWLLMKSRALSLMLLRTLKITVSFPSMEYNNKSGTFIYSSLCPCVFFTEDQKVSIVITINRNIILSRTSAHYS